ncbi:MAG: helix-turn-helix domain-containing protein [Chitinophagales bacterium]|nr:helix-turn-helix domain-containing protein [Hyphomicrobiales bacterium]
MSGYYRISHAHIVDLFRFEVPGFNARIARSRYEGKIDFQHYEFAHRVFVTLAGGTAMTVAKAEGAPVVRRPDRPGAVTVIPSQTPRAVTLTDGDMTFLSLSIDPNFALDDTPSEAGDRPTLLQNGRDDWLNRAASEFRLASQAAAPRMQYESLARAIARYLRKTSKARRSPGLDPAALLRVLALMHDSAAEDLSLTDLAAECGLSVSAFGRAFRQTIGRTPHRYFISIRMARAKALLKRPRLPLVEIAASAGYSDQAHFTAAFTRHEGVSPGRWRQLQQM